MQIMEVIKMNNNDPFSQITGISPEKLTILRNLESKISKLPPEMAIPYIAKANSELNARGMSFSQSELNCLFDALTKDMPPAKKQRVDILRGMLNNNR